MFHRNRLTTGVYAAMALGISCLPRPASAQNNTPIIPFSQIAGAPLPAEKKLPAGFYIRRGADKADDEIVVVSHGLNGDKTRGVVFTGTITVNAGLVQKIRPLFLEKEHKEGYVVRGNVIEFRFLTFADIDGLGFRVQKGLKVTFTLFADGRPVQSVAFGGKPEWVDGNMFTLDTAK